MSEPNPSPWWERFSSPRLRSAARVLALTAGLLVGIFIFATYAFGDYPPEQWLFTAYARYWALALIFNLACFAPGFAIMLRWIPHGLPLRERLVLSMAVGVLTFFMGAYLLGLAKAYGTGFFLAYPFILIWVGAVGSWKYFRRAVPLWRHVRRMPFRRWSALEVVLFASGVVALLIIYGSVIVPENSAYDAKWYHMPIAEHYAAIGGIEPFVEGWYQGALPHLSSVLYTWVMLTPGVPMVDLVLTCAHLEFSLFLWTLAALPVLVRWLVPTARPRLAWVAMFLFPGLFLYDSNLNTTADHIAAFWGVPLFLALGHAWKALEVRWAALLGAMLAAALLTKYQAASLVVLPVLAVVVRFVFLTVKAPSGKRWLPLLAAVTAGGVMILVFAPHWAKNWLWYGDPAYPWLHKFFNAKQWNPDTLTRLESIYDNHLWQPKGTTTEKLLKTAQAVGNFSLVPNDWDSLHRNVPVFGSLFTLLVFSLPFLRASRRVWGLFASANVGVFVWYWMSHQDRYLQALVPWMAAFTGAALILAWRSGALVRLGVIGLVGLQVVWGSDVPFIGTHRQTGVSPLKFAVDRISSGFDRKQNIRLGVGSGVQAIGDILPKGAKILLHEEEPHLGLRAAHVSDWSEWQGGMSYGRFRSPAEVHDRFLEYGVTHIGYIRERSRDRDALPGDIVFFDYILHYAKPWKTAESWTLVTPAEKRPPETPYRPVLWLGCENLYVKGVYDFSAIMTPFWGTRRKEDVGKPRHTVSGSEAAELESSLAEVDSVALDPRCNPLRPISLGVYFVRMAMRGPVELWIRK